jgi:hypothetical protein
MYEEILTIYNYNRRVDFALSDRSLMVRVAHVAGTVADWSVAVYASLDFILT